MNERAIARYVELSHEQVSARGQAFGCVRGPAEDGAEERYTSLSIDLDTLWAAMDPGDQDEVERRLVPMLAYGAAYDDMQCHVCSVVIFTRRRGSSLPWRALRPRAHPLHCHADPSGPRFLLCQDCATKALEACDHASYEQMIEDHETRVTSPAYIAALAEQDEQARADRVDALVINQRQLIETQRTQIEHLKKLDATAEKALKTAAQLEASSSRVIENQKVIIDARNEHVAQLERLVRALGGVLPEQAQA